MNIFSQMVKDTSALRQRDQISDGRAVMDTTGLGNQLYIMPYKNTVGIILSTTFCFLDCLLKKPQRKKKS